MKHISTVQVSRVWAVIALIALAACQPIVAPTPGAAPATTTTATPAVAATNAELYTDPQGRFTVPIPTNWQAEPVDDTLRLSGPAGLISVYVVVVPQATPDAPLDDAIATAWAKVEPTFAAPVIDVTEVPPESGIERMVSVSYDTDEGAPVAAAIGMLVKGDVYALLFRGDQVAIGQRSAQLAIIQTGLTIAGVEATSLVGVEPRPLDAALQAELASYVQRKLEQYGIPGAEVAVVQAGEIVYAHGFGVRALGSDETVTPETLMMIGSTGKTMTTMMMATVVDDGLMTWDTPVQAVLPQFAVADPDLSQTITMRNLVCACTGVPRRDLQLLFNANELSAEDIVASLQGFEFFTDFGEAFQYSNQLVATAGYATAAALGVEWGDLYAGYVSAMDERVFGPIGMASTTYDFDAVIASGNYAMPHSVGVEAPYTAMPLDEERFVLPVAPAGATWSNALDMARYLITELNGGVAPDGTRVVSTENLAETWVPQIAVSADTAYGLGWFVDEYKGLRLMQHGGNTLGFSSDLAFLPDAGIGISVVSNGRVTNAFNEAVRYRLLELIFDQPMEFDAQADFAQQAMRDALLEAVGAAGPVEEATVAPFLMTYSNPELGEFTLAWDEGKLYADVGEFRMEVRAVPPREESGTATPTPTAAGDVTRALETIIYDAPFTGLPLQLETSEDGQRQVRLGGGVDEYLFTPTE